MASKTIIKAGIVNESETNVERLAAKIVELRGGNTPFIKTCVSLTDKHNAPVLRTLWDELTPSANRGFLGFSIVSYANANYIEFYSAIRSFALKQGTRIAFYFEDGQQVNFEFTSPNQSYGFMKRNHCFVSDAMLEYMAHNKLHHWMIETVERKTVTGGFECSEHIHQYKTKKAGQQLFQNMVKEILALKPVLKAS